uniref:Uncharacterized protein n=1 Tax=Glossina pallidipes TaxID=7398 RepID=A0A1A9ZB11_GLOPL
MSSCHYTKRDQGDQGGITSSVLFQSSKYRIAIAKGISLLAYLSPLMGCQTAFYKSRNRRSRSRGRGRGRFQFDPLNLLMKNEIFVLRCVNLDVISERIDLDKLILCWWIQDEVLHFVSLNITLQFSRILTDIMRACKQVIPSLLSSALRLTS